MASPTPPAGAPKIYNHQVAGSHTETPSQFRQERPDRVLKPYKVTPKLKRVEDPQQEEDDHDRVFENEFIFYEELQHREDLAELRRLTPAYHGRVMVPLDGVDTPHLSLSNLTQHCRWPCVADIKMAAKDTRGKTPERRLALKSKYPSLGEIGWCIAGLKQYSAAGSLLSALGPSVSGAFSAATVRAVLGSFLLCPGGAPLDAQVLPLLLQLRGQLSAVLAWFRGQRRYWLRNSSLLLVYNAEALTNWSDAWTQDLKVFGSSSEENDLSSGDVLGVDQRFSSKLVVRVKMIDFAHVLDANDSLDHKYIRGLEDLMDLLGMLTNESERR